MGEYKEDKILIFISSVMVWSNTPLREKVVISIPASEGHTTFSNLIMCDVLIRKKARRQGKTKDLMNLPATPKKMQQRVAMRRRTRR